MACSAVTPLVVASLPCTVNRSVSTQSAIGPATVGQASTVGLGLMPGPSMRKKLVPYGLPLILCAVAPSPT